MKASSQGAVVAVSVRMVLRSDAGQRKLLGYV